jgi:hypothetical protein
MKDEIQNTKYKRQKKSTDYTDEHRLKDKNNTKYKNW